MADQYREPIEDSDVGDLREKFVGGGHSPAITIASREMPVTPERATERVQAERDTAYHQILQKVSATQDDDTASQDHTIVADARNSAMRPDAESQIQHLVDVAVTKGVTHAVKVARHMEDNYILDVFHDRMLADELHDALVKKGLI